MVIQKTKRNESCLPILKRAILPPLQIYMVAQERQSHATSCQGCKQRHFFHHTVPRAEGLGHLNTLTSNRCLFLERMLVMWETQNVRERRESPVSHHRKSLPKHKIQHATVRRKAGSKTMIKHWCPKVSLARYNGATESHLRVRRSPGSSSRAPHLPALASDSAGPSPSGKERLARTEAFPKRPGLGQIRRRPAGRRAVGTGVGGAA